MNVYYLSLKPDIPANDYWAYGFLNDFIKGDMWQPPSFKGFTMHEVSELLEEYQALVVIPGEYHADMVQEINEEINKIQHVILFIMADEEANFPVDAIDHPSIHIWVQYPYPGKHDQYNKLGTGYPPQSQEILPTLRPDKLVDIFFSGQIVHKRRQELVAGLREWQAQGNTAAIIETKGFTQGIEPKEYYKLLTSAQIAPAPAGTVTPDSFRAFEALESMCILMADERDAYGKIDAYWDWLFDDECPFYKTKEWDNLVGWAHEAKKNWPNNVHKQTAWWIKKKRDFAYKVMEQLNA